MSTGQKPDLVAPQFVRDEDRLLLSGQQGVLINVLKISNDLLLEVADALPRDASVISELISTYPVPLVNCVKGIVLEEVPDQESDCVKRPSEASVSIFGADARDFGLYLIQHRSGRAATTLEVGSADPEIRGEFVTAFIDSEHIDLLDGNLQSKELVTSVVINDEVIPIEELQFYSESQKSYLVVISKALGIHLLCRSEGQVFQTKDCSFIGCFALMDVLLVARGDTERARKLLDLAAEQASLVRDYVDLARAADVLSCPKFVIEALARRASMALRDDDRNRNLNVPYIPQLAELYCSHIAEGTEEASDLLAILLEEKPDPRSLREGADVAERLLGDSETSSHLNDLALSLSNDDAEGGSIETLRN